MMVANKFNLSTIPNKTIRIGAYLEEPYVFECFMSYPYKCQNLGTDLEYIYTIVVNIIGLNIEWKQYYDSVDAFGGLKNNEIDIIGSTEPSGYTLISNETWFETSPVQYWTTGFFVKSTLVSKTINPFICFSWDLWTCVITVSVLLYLMDRFMSLRLRFSARVSYLLHMFWFVILLFIMGFYGDILTDNLVTFDKEKALFSDLDVLGDKLIMKECRLVIFSQYENDTDMQSVINPQYLGHNPIWKNRFRLAYTVNPPIVVDTKETLFAFVENGTCNVGLDFVTYDLSLYDTMCEIDVITFPDDIPYIPEVFYHRRGDLDSVLNSILSTSQYLNNYLLKRYTKILIKPMPTDCKVVLKTNDYILSMHKLSYTFFFLIAGLLISAIITVYRNCKQNSQYATINATQADQKECSSRLQQEGNLEYCTKL